MEIFARKLLQRVLGLALEQRVLGLALEKGARLAHICLGDLISSTTSAKVRLESISLLMSSNSKYALSMFQQLILPPVVLG
jgi:hypothetical protein